MRLKGGKMLTLMFPQNIGKGLEDIAFLSAFHEKNCVLGKWVLEEEAIKSVSV